MPNTKIKKLLTLNDLEQFYSSKKKSFHFSAKEDEEAVVVQVPGLITFSEDDYNPTLGLLPVHLQSCHIGENRNRSNVSEDSMNQAIPSIYNRPILGFIHQLSDGSYDFAGHEIFINDNEEIEYEEIAVGTIPESCNAKLVYDEEKKKTYLEVDGFIYEEYTRAADILKEKKQCKVSVELNLLEFSYDAKSKCLNIDKFYFSGVTILGVTRDESEKTIEEGMYGSNIKLKDFSVENNSMFSNETEEMKEKLIEMQESINILLSRFNINDSQESNENYGKEEENVEENILVNEDVTKESKTEEEVTETESTEEVTETVTESEETEGTPEVVETEGCKKKKCEEEDVDDDTVTETEGCKKKEKESEEIIETEGCKKKKCEEDPDDKDDDLEDNDPDDMDDDKDDDLLDTNGCKKKKCEEESVDNIKFTKTFELSHDDIRAGLYNLLMAYEEAENDCYFIADVFDDYFVYQSWMTNKLFGQKYFVEDDIVSFDGERYELFVEYLTESEKIELENMRSNYSSIQTELNSYKEAESIADKMTVFEDQAYANYLDTDEFKSLMDKDTIQKFSKEELSEKADAALGKLVKATKTFAMKEEKKEAKKPAFFAFAKVEKDTSFLDGLLKK